MDPGDLVIICPGFPGLGIIIGPCRPHSGRTRVFFDNSVFSVPTTQLEVISESR